MPAKGKFIVLEGTDGSGKTMQFERLILALPEGTRVGTLDFPQYAEPSSYFVQKYLSGKYGGDLDPRAAAALFAVDRFDVKLKILQWLDEGRLVVANRYVASNMAHQGAKIANKNEREKFYKWVHELEYEILGIPKPDLNILLHVPADIAWRHLEKKKRNLHEADFDHQKRAEEVYLEIAALYPGDFTVIECALGGVLLPPEEIHKKVWAAARVCYNL